jgi:hypothetical protein
MVLLNRKGTVNTIVTAILIIIAAGILLMVFPTLLGDSTKILDRTKCKTQVNLHSIDVAELKFPGKIDQCVTNNIEIDSKDEEEIKETIAYEMYDCWDQFGEGKKDFMTEWSDDKWCFICSRIDFDKSVNKEYPTVGNFDVYLRETKFPYFRENKTVNFYDYLYGENNIESLGEGFNINTSKTNYVLFFADKEEDPAEVAKGIGTAVVGTAACAGGIYLAVQTGGFLTPVAIFGCKYGGAAALGGVGYAAKYHPDFYAGLYVGDAEGVIGVCGGG